MTGRMVFIVAGVAHLFAGAIVAQALPAFPGAEGFGANTVGGRGGRVLFVTTLDDYNPKAKKSTPIAGSLRASLEAEGPRTIVFRVSGVIALQAPLRISQPFVTIAGQSAPGGGVCLKAFGCSVETHDVVIRHLRFRPGDVAQKPLDALSVYQAQNVILDHCSAGWSVDETLSVTGAGCTNVSVQWCLIAESLNHSVHAKGEHGYGSLVRTDGDISYHHNVYAHHGTRCPRPGTYGEPRGIVFDFRNNLIYDWRGPAGYSSEDKATLNYLGNYLKPGPSTRDTKKHRAFSVGGPATKMYVAGNYLVGADEANRDNWLMIEHHTPETRLAEPLPVAAVQTDPAESLPDKLLPQVGATLPRRDAADVRVIEQIRRGTGRIIDSQSEVGGWPTYDAAPPPADGDDDGMPDDWERQHGLDPANAADGPADRDGDGYTNLEEYLNQIR